MVSVIYQQLLYQFFTSLIDSFTCDYCGKRFISKHLLILHITTHLANVNKPFECRNCKKKFTSVSQRNIHEAIHINMTPFKCNLCTKAFTSLDVLKKHKMTSHLKIFRCDQCPYKVQVKYYMENHIENHIKPLKCKKCNKTFIFDRDLINHLKDHKKRNKFQCHCGKPFASSRAMKIHGIKQHKDECEGERTFKCKYCDHASWTKALWERHEATHEKKFKCANCKKGFSDQKGLETHLMLGGQFNCLFDRKTEFTCKVCQKEFKSMKDLRQHSKMHAEKVQCPICSQFYSAISVKAHIKRHEIKKNEPKFECDVCFRAFFLQEHLHRHAKNHDKPFECDYCGFNVKSKFQLENHFLFHFDQTNQLKCQICRKNFTHKQSYTNHMETVHN